MKESSINEILVDLKTLGNITEKAEKKEKSEEKSKYFVSFSSEYEIFEDVLSGTTYESDNGELLLSIVNKKNEIFRALMDYINKTKENIKTIKKAVVINLFDHYQYIEKLKQDLIDSEVNISVVNMLCDDLTEFINSYISKQDEFLTQYNSNRKDKLDMEDLLSDNEKLHRFVELPDFKKYFIHDKNDLKGVRIEIKENIRLIDEENERLIENNNNLLSGMLNYLYSIITFFLIVDKQIDRKANNSLDELLIEPLNIPRSETNFEKIPQTRKTKKDKLEGQLQIVTRYEISSLDELLNIYIRDIIQNKIVIKKCKNCGEYFLPNNKQIYCEKCKTIPYDMRKNTSIIKVTYRNNYKNQHNKMARNMKKDKFIREKFENWNKRAKEMTKKCEKGIISLEELKTWFKTSQKWNKE